MSDDPASPGGFSIQLRQERLLDEFEALCREGNASAVLKFVDLYQSVSPSLFVEFVKVAQQYDIDLVSTAVPQQTKARDLPTSVGDPLKALETEIVRSPGADPHSPLMQLFGEQEALKAVGLQSGFRVLKELGSGGMGVVLLAEDQQLKRQVAIKVMRPHIAKIPGARERFLREARTMAAIENDHVVQVYHVGEESGLPYLAMPYLKGAPLDQLLRKQGAIPSAIALKIGLQVCLGLAAAHSKGLIHRDIKPANIWIETHRSWRVKLLDFGLARIAESEVSLTGRGEMLGTPAYMAPEQALGEEITIRADLFSVGVVLYELLIGKRPFDGPSALAVLAKIAHFDPKPPHEVDNRIDVETSQFVMKLLSKECAGRPFSATDCARELSRLLAAVKKSPESAATPLVTPVPAAPMSPTEETYPGRSLDTVQTSRALLDFPNYDPLAPVTPYPGPAKPQFQATPLIVAGFAVLLSVAILPVALILLWPVIFPKAKDTADSTTLAKREGEENKTTGDQVESNTNSQSQPAEIRDQAESPKRETSAATKTGSETSPPATTPPASSSPGGISPGPQKQLDPPPVIAKPEPLPPRPIVNYNDPKKPLATATAGKYEVELVLLSKADEKRHLAVRMSDGSRYPTESAEDAYNLLLGMRVKSPLKEGSEGYAISASYELQTAAAHSIVSPFDKAFYVQYSVLDDNLLPLCVSVPIESEPTVIKSLKGYLVSRPQARILAEFSDAEARRGSNKSLREHQFEIESYEESDEGLKVTVAFTVPVAVPDVPRSVQDVEKMAIEAMNQPQFGILVKDKSGMMHTPGKYDALGGGIVGSTFSFEKQFEFGNNTRPGNRNSKEKVTTKTNSTPYRFQYTFETLGGAKQVSKFQCGVFHFSGEPKWTPFEFRGIKITE